MKSIYFMFTLLATLISCKPTIYNVDSLPDVFCECSGGQLQYQLKNANRSSLAFDPSSAVTEISEEIGPGGQAVVRFRICESGSATITAVNGNGASTHTFQFRKISEPSSYGGTLNPVCTGARFAGWSWLPLYDANLPQPYPSDGVLSSIRIEVDRAGVFMYNSRTVDVSPGVHQFNDFDGMNPNVSNYEFMASLNADEQCAESGAVLPSGRRPPRNFPITITVRCP